MLRISIVLLLTVAFVSAGFAQQQRHLDVQSLQYEFGQNVVPVPPRPPVFAPAPCAQLVVFAPVPRCHRICAPVWHCPPVVCLPVARVHCSVTCVPCFTPRCVPAPRIIHRRVFLRPVHVSPHFWW